MLNRFFKNARQSFHDNPNNYGNRRIWIGPVKPKNSFEELKKPSYTDEEAKAIIIEHTIGKLKNHSSLKFAAEHLDLIDTIPKTSFFFRGETYYKGRDIPDNTYQLERNTSVTSSVDFAKRFRSSKIAYLKEILETIDTLNLNKEDKKLFSLLQPKLWHDNETNKDGRVSTVILPPNTPCIRIPLFESYIHEQESVLPIGTLIRTQKNGEIIRVLSPYEEQYERNKVNN